MDIKLEIVLFVVFGFFLLVGSFWVTMTEKRLKRFFMGKNGKNLEDNILALENEIVKLKKAREDIEKEMGVMNLKMRKSIRGLETIRFNPFSDQGSNQSFAIGLLNEDGDGVILSSLYARERMSVFAKPIKNRKSDYELTTEEKEVLDKAHVK
ncbi:MAG: DUF4446 family protein [Patescibacteria group bacterium]